jgi:hypothetical protein
MQKLRKGYSRAFYSNNKYNIETRVYNRINVLYTYCLKEMNNIIPTDVLATLFKKYRDFNNLDAFYYDLKFFIEIKNYMRRNMNLIHKINILYTEVLQNEYKLIIPLLSFCLKEGLIKPHEYYIVLNLYKNKNKKIVLEEFYKCIYKKILHCYL